MVCSYWLQVRTIFHRHCYLIVKSKTTILSQDGQFFSMLAYFWPETAEIIQNEPSIRESPADLWRKLTSAACMSFYFGHYQQFMTIFEARNKMLFMNR